MLHHGDGSTTVTITRPPRGGRDDQDTDGASWAGTSVPSPRFEGLWRPLSGRVFRSEAGIRVASGAEAVTGRHGSYAPSEALDDASSVATRDAYGQARSTPVGDR